MKQQESYRKHRSTKQMKKQTDPCTAGNILLFIKKISRWNILYFKELIFQGTEWYFKELLKHIYTRFTYMRVAGGAQIAAIPTPVLRKHACNNAVHLQVPEPQGNRMVRMRFPCGPRFEKVHALFLQEMQAGHPSQMNRLPCPSKCGPQKGIYLSIYLLSYSYHRRYYWCSVSASYKLMSFIYERWYLF